MGERVLEWVANAILLVAALFAFNFGARKQRWSPNPRIASSLVWLMIGIAVFASVYGGFFGWCRLVTVPAIEHRLRAGEPLSLLDGLLLWLGHLGTFTVSCVFVAGCAVLTAVAGLADHSGEDSGDDA